MANEPLRILLIEDNPGDARLVQAYLEEAEDFKSAVTHVQTLHEGLEHLAADGFDAVLLDLGLPESAGLDTLEQVRKQSPDIAIIVLTGLDAVEIALRAIRAGADNYLGKNWLTSELLVRTILYACKRKQSEEAVRKEQQLLRKLLEIHETERQLTAYEIHDGFVQLAVGAQLRLQAFRQHRQCNPDAAKRALDEALRLLSQSIGEARRLISGLRPPILDESGIIAALEYLACEAQQYKLDVELHHRVRFNRLAAPLESAVFRIVQECLNNILRHSGSPKARIMITQIGERLRVVVEDWGAGFDPQQPAINHFGLQGIRERARLMGGRVAIRTAAGRGTRITVELPLLTRNNVDDE